MNKHLFLGLFLLLLAKTTLLAQSYFVAANSNPATPPIWEGSYQANTTSDGVANYKHTSENFFIYRIQSPQLGGQRIWVFSSTLDADIDFTDPLADFSLIADNTPTLGKWEFSLIFLSVPLPIELAQFSALEKPNFVELTWKTISESNNKGFELQRSTNGSDFQFLTWVVGGGNRNQVANYSFQDYQLMGIPDQIYYRLKQVDHDESIYYSKVIALHLTHSANRNLDQSGIIFPNPVQYQINWKATVTQAAVKRITILDHQSRVYLTTDPESNAANQLAVDHLSPGHYVLLVELKDRKRIHYPFIKK